ncbi:hypothetical protein [Agromyces aerolatus]|uniref:hypothetical protein n=1 Tax=Agromyces sp. LY-1074 TaxID=3074080 RepID=UPI0028669089|nr:MULTISPECIES: hypothetical protein [unclassified Agromyces]MDR5701654.1 hypothetical protein [Agromyces sp. LY-1074]MDR5707906.1 hypothetical protein [Agromyces sp. LY-1358]
MLKHSSRARSLGLIALAGTLATGALAPLIGATAAPAIAAEWQVGHAASPVLVDAGNGITANVNPATGVVQLETSAAGATWDTAIHEMDRYGLGPGGTWGTASADIRGGTSVYVPGMGVYAPDPAERSGLRGYPGDDLNFSQDWGTLPARGDIPAQEYVFTLHHLDTGAVDHFAPNGDVIASIDAAGDRTDWEFTPGPYGSRLERIVDPAGAITKISYSPDVITVTAPDGQSTTLESSFGRLTKLTTPTGTSAFSALPGLFSRIVSTTPSGDTVTGFTWNQDKPGSVIQITRNGEIVYPKG